MSRSTYVFAPLLAATATTVLSGCRGAPVHHQQALIESAVETRRGGFSASFENHPAIWWFLAAGAIVVAGRFVSPGE